MEEIIDTHDVIMTEGNISLSGNIYIKDYNKSWIIFAYGSGRARKNARNIALAKELTKAGHATFLFDQLTPEEDNNLENHFNISLLASRLLMATKWLMNSKYYQKGTPIGHFGMGTAVAAALILESDFSPRNLIYAVISCAGRPDLVDEKRLSTIFAPTLLIVGSEDRELIELNKLAAQSLLNCRLVLVAHATHLFEEPGTMNEVSRLAIEWFDNHVPNIIEHKLLP